jgi:VanZ family protein
MKIRSFFLHYYRSIAIFIIILVASLISSEEISNVSLFSFPQVDKGVHFGMYFTFSLVLVYDIFKAKTGFTFIKIYFISGIMAVSYGGIIELAQWLFTKTRSGDLYDFLFDLAGALFAVFTWSVLKKFK